MANPAWKVASDVADGYVSLNPVVLKKYERHEVDALLKELEKLTRDTRSQVVRAGRRRGERDPEPQGSSASRRRTSSSRAGE